MLEENLAEFGFSPSEIRVYLQLLRVGSSYANKISSKTGINRTNVYEALDRLVAKGVISNITRNKVKWFEAKSPDSLLSLVKEKEEEFESSKESLLSDISSLKKSMPLKKESLEAGVFVGRKGLRMLFEEILDVAKPVSIIAAELQFRDFFGPYFEKWHKRRVGKGIKQRSIFPKRFRKILHPRKFLKYKFVDDQFTNPTTTILYGDSCLFIQWSKEPIAIKIQNREITKSHLNHFNLLWDS